MDFWPERDTAVVGFAMPNNNSTHTTEYTTLDTAEYICRGISNITPTFVDKQILESTFVTVSFTLSFKENTFQQPGGRVRGSAKFRI